MITRAAALSYERCTIELHCKQLGVEQNEYLVGYRTNTGLGYYVVPGYIYDERQEDDRFILTYLPSGLHLGFRLFDEEQLHQAMEQIVSLVDWTKSQAELQTEIGLPGKVREILWSITAGDFEQIPGEVPEPVCENLDDLLHLALQELKIERDQIEGEVFFTIGEGDCMIAIQNSNVLLWDSNFGMQSFDEPDWQVFGVEPIQEVL